MKNEMSSGRKYVNIGSNADEKRSRLTPPKVEKSVMTTPEYVRPFIHLFNKEGFHMLKPQ